MRDSPALNAGFEPQGFWRSRAPAVRVALRLLLAQAAVGLAAASVWLLAAGASAAAAAGAGAAIALLPTAYFAAKVFSQRPGTAPRALLRAIYVGEVVKLILTAALFMIALRWLSGDFLALISTYAAALGTYWFMFWGTLRT